MSKKAFWLSVIAVIVSFAGGFLLANALNRRELDDLRAEIGRLKKPSPVAEETNSHLVLTDEEISQKIAEADKNPDNIEYQKSLAVALYSYANARQDIKLLPEVARLLERAQQKNPQDYNTIVSLGNIYFDIGQSGNDAKAMRKSREFYQKALEIKPDDTNVRTDLGLTYLLAAPPENEKAIAEFQKTLKIKPKDEKALENTITALINSGKMKEAEEFLEKLKQANPNNQALPELETKLKQSKNNKQ